MKKTRRDFLKVSTASAVGLWSSQTFAGGEEESFSLSPFQINEGLLSVEAHRDAEFIGQKRITDFEGDVDIPVEGTYFRVAPGTKSISDRNYKHFFDGDAYLYSLEVSKEGVFLKAKFIDTPERKREQRSGRQIYSEFGTSAPGLIKLKKNSPGINVIPWQDTLLCLSDTSPPTAIDMSDFSYLGEYNFSNTLSGGVTFTAHPKKDPRSGLFYAYGITRSLSPNLEIYEIDPRIDQSKRLHSYKLDHIPMVHDMIVTENYILVFAPPMKISMTKMILQQKSYAESLEVLEGLSSKLYVFPKNSSKEAFTVDMPHSFSFHHGNAFEEGEFLSVTTFAAPDASIFDYLLSWNQTRPASVTSLSQLREWTIDLRAKEFVQETVLYEGCDFPRLNEDYMGVKNRYLYSVGQNSRPILNEEPKIFMGSLGAHNQPLFNSNYDGDLLAFKQIVKYDLEKRRFLRKDFPIHQTIGEALFVPEESPVLEDDGYLLYMGYDKKRKESFFDVLEASDFSLKTRCWMGCHLPMGFHANFV